MSAAPVVAGGGTVVAAVVAAGGFWLKFRSARSDGAKVDAEADKARIDSGAMAVGIYTQLASVIDEKVARACAALDAQLATLSAELAAKHQEVVQLRLDLDAIAADRDALQVRAEGLELQLAEKVVEEDRLRQRVDLLEEELRTLKGTPSP